MTESETKTLRRQNTIAVGSSLLVSLWFLRNHQPSVWLGGSALSVAAFHLFYGIAERSRVPAGLFGVAMFFITGIWAALHNGESSARSFFAALASQNALMFAIRNRAQNPVWLAFATGFVVLMALIN